MPRHSDNTWLERIAGYLSSNTDSFLNKVLKVQGNSDSAATDSGSPVKVGGKYNSSPITLTNGQRGDLQLDVNGYLNVDVKSGGSSTAQGTYNATPPVLTDTQVSSVQLDSSANLKVTQATAMDEDIDSITSYTKGYTYTRLSADGVVSAAPVNVAGYYVEASSSGVISLYDNASAASGNAMLALSKAVTTNDLVVLETPVSMANGLYFDLVSGTATVSILTRKVTAA